ncbi:hypothetical protein F1188_06490 [Roseospira marina]|uniref:Polysaccharide chain length determinant N-terminal domain-containing protein n=1 Tax=Roseospira marina TaxID=140057 RepID=A0A5M6IEY8_9PROT|nr:Wzz/FepE/Etk N-terminal domain-containing protein [Roseospira marina]KAA5606507.1 hypothetical protein F1188_06490 [Roseospira marina]MBB4314070.1 uncharacterized protein involved in exopolysaccharide biosynthesis [Roseospira marina]MBB5087231.1 uncharacterized protein involved in exopolysaccharide biosynthesis [Roseospira marina]
MSTSAYDDDTESLDIDVAAIWRAVKRRFWLFVLPVLVFGSLSVLIAKLVPPVYRSSGMIVIEQPNVPPDLVDSTVTSLAAERIEVIKQRFIATDNLISLIREHNLYPWLRQSQTLTQVASAMRKDILVNVYNQNYGRQTYTVAFQVGFTYREPEKARVIADALASWYLSENARNRQERAQETAVFLEQETKAAETEVNRLEAELAEWTNTYSGRLPAQQSLMQQRLDEARQRRRDMTLRLEVQESERSSLAARLSSLRNSGGGSGSVASPDRARLLDLLQSLRNERASLSTVVTERHPDMARLNRQIADVEAQLAGLPAASGTASAYDPAVEQELSLRLDQLDREIAASKRAMAALDDDIKALEDDLSESAEISDKYQALVRERDNAVEDFNLLRRKLLEAEMGASLEISQKSERFTLVDPPQVPVDREGLPPMLIALGGIVASGGLGVVAMAGAEFFDTRLRSARKVEQLVGAAPLVVIPEISTRRERLLRWGVRLLVAAATLAVVAGGVWYVDSQIMPLDVLYLVLQRKIEAQINLLGW